MINKLRTYISEYFVGKEDTVENVLICLLAEGHILLEGVPGVGKTTLASALAKSIACVCLFQNLSKNREPLYSG